MVASSRDVLHVPIGAEGYSIHIGHGIRGNTELLLSRMPSKRAVLVTNKTVWDLCSKSIAEQLSRAGADVLPVCLPDGEAFKSWDSMRTIFDAMLSRACDRRTTLIAIGGGVVGDIGGFAAATYQRGIPLIQIPTTLLSQVDSSVGGKTGINHPLGKNMIGAFYQPQLVVADTEVLNTLPDREYLSGLAEVFKYGLIQDREFFEWLERNVLRLSKRDPETLRHAIRRSCEIKSDFVAADERETRTDGGRALLNLGHTFGHAIESALGYGTWLHGEAVAVGIMLAAKLSHAHGNLTSEDVARIGNLFATAGLPTQLPSLAASEMIRFMRLDKKNEAQQIRLILLRRIGCAVVNNRTSEQELVSLLIESGALQ